MAVGLCLWVDSDCLTEGIADLEATRQSAGKCAADPDANLSGRLLTKPRVKGNKFEDVDRLKFKALGDPVHTAVIDKTKVVLPEMKERERGAPLGDGIMGDRFIDPEKEVGRNLICLFGNRCECNVLIHGIQQETKNEGNRKEGNQTLHTRG